MKKNISLACSVALWICLLPLFACSYHSLEPEVQTAQPSLTQHKPFPEKALETDIQKSKAENSLSPSLKDEDEITRHQKENEKTQSKASSPATLMSDQELQSLTGSSTLKRNNKDSNKLGQTNPLTEETVLLQSEQVEEKDEKESKGSSSSEQGLAGQDERPVSGKKPIENSEPQASEFKRMPVQLDDATAGDAPDVSDIPMSAEEGKQGNSNINHKGRDSDLIEDRKRQRFWNLQRQL